jgi:hypothetical protein
MKLLLYIQIVEQIEQIKFYNPLLSLLKEESSDVVVYELDNFSDSLLIGYANRLLSEAEKTVVAIDITVEGKLNSLGSLLSKIVDSPQNKLIIVKGDNLRLNKILSILHHIKTPEITQEIERIQQFFGEIE